MEESRTDRLSALSVVAVYVAALLVGLAVVAAPVSKTTAVVLGACGGFAATVAYATATANHL